MLLANNITFKRNDKIILQNINLSLSPKKIIYVTGNNGVGKTTLLKILTYILIPDEGEIFWNGHKISKNLFDFFKNVTFIMDEKTSNLGLTVKENILFWKKLFSSSIRSGEIDSILEILSLKKYENTLVSNLSNGEIKKLELSRLIIENKKLWILDEPYSSLDKTSIELINQTLINHINNNGMIILTSHLLPEIPNQEILQLKNYENH